MDFIECINCSARFQDPDAALQELFPEPVVPLCEPCWSNLSRESKHLFRLMLKLVAPTEVR